MNAGVGTIVTGVMAIIGIGIILNYLSTSLMGDGQVFGTTGAFSQARPFNRAGRYRRNRWLHLLHVQEVRRRHERRRIAELEFDSILNHEL